MQKRTSRSLVVICLLLVGFVAYLWMSGLKKTESTPSAEIAEKATDAPAPSTAAKSDQKMMPQPDSSPQSQVKAAVPVNPAETKPDFLAEARKAVNDPDIAVRVQAVRQLRNETSEEALVLLQGCLNDPSSPVVTSALNSLAFLGAKEAFGEKVLEILREKAVDENFPERGQALIIAALFTRDDRMLPVISEYISADDGSSEEDRKANILYAAQALGAIRSPVCIDPLQQILASTQDPTVRKMVFYTLARIEDPASSAILQQNLRYGDKADRLDSASALAAVNKPEYNDILLETLVNEEVDDQVLAAISRSPAGPAVFEKVIYRNGVDKAAQIKYLDIMQNSLLMSTDETRAGILNTVAPLLDSNDPDLEMKAIQIYGMGFGELETADLLQPKLKSSDEKVRKVALNAYRPYVTENSYKPLLELIWDKDEAVRRQALMIARRYIDQSDYPLLEKAKDHEDEFIREQVASILN